MLTIRHVQLCYMRDPYGPDDHHTCTDETWQSAVGLEKDHFDEYSSILEQNREETVLLLAHIMQKAICRDSLLSFCSCDVPLVRWTVKEVIKSSNII